MVDLQMLCNEVFTHRMGGGSMSTVQTSIVARFVNAMPRVPVKSNLDAGRIAAGKAIFEGSGGCTACHVGGTGTLPVNQDIGKADSSGPNGQALDTPLQVPILVGVADRAPYMHDGCAATLADRFDLSSSNISCVGTHHGNTAQLSADDITNVIEFLQSL